MELYSVKITDTVQTKDESKYDIRSTPVASAPDQF